MTLTEGEGNWAFLHPQETDSLAGDSRRHQDSFRIYPIYPGQTQEVEDRAWLTVRKELV